MVLTVQHPCYLASISYFQKVVSSDIVVLTDDFQYTKHDYINRGQIKTVKGANWLSLPTLTRGHFGQLIRDVKIDSAQDWQRKHWKTLRVNYIYAAYFEHFRDFFEKLYAVQWKFLLDINVRMMSYLSEILKIETRVVFSSDLDLPERSDLRLLEMLRVSGCDQLLVDVKYRSVVEPSLFFARGYDLKFVRFSSHEYHQQFDRFVSDLSALDLVFNEGPEARAFLESK